MMIDGVRIEVATSKWLIDSFCDLAYEAELYSPNGMFKSFYNNSYQIEAIALANLNGKYIGSAVLLFNEVFSASGMVNYGVYVKPEYRLRGIGRILTAKLAPLATKPIKVYKNKSINGFFHKVLFNANVTRS